MEQGKAVVQKWKRENVQHDVWDAFPPDTGSAPTHARHETISRLRGGGCLKANSLAQPRLVTFFFWQIVFTILGGGHCVLRYVALHHSPCLAESQRVSCLRKGRLRRGMPSRLRSRHQIATMCEAASMTRGNLNDVYAPMMFLHSYTW